MSKIFTTLLLMSALLSGCMPLYQEKGYANEGDYAFAQTIGNSTPQRIAALKSYGITTKVAFDKAVTEMRADNYAQEANWSDILFYLKDKKDAQISGVNVLIQRDNRIASEKKAELQRQAQQKREKEEYAKKFPFTAVLACEFQGRNIGQLAVCFLGSNSRGTELALRNGSSVRVYKGYELQNLGREQRDGLNIPLERSYEITAQNDSRDYILTLKIKNTATGEVLIRQAAGMYKVVRAKN